MISRLSLDSIRYFLFTVFCVVSFAPTFVMSAALAAKEEIVLSSQNIKLIQTSDQAQQSQSFPTDGEYFIGPADKLQISVWKNDALSHSVTVRPDGMISLPLINEVKAAGMKPMQLRQIIKNKLKDYIPNPEVSVIVTEMHSFIVSVLGEVRKPGRYQFNSQVTVLDVLAQSGGITEFASTSNLFVLRPEGSKTRQIPFNYSKIMTGPVVDNSNFNVKPGDILVVP